MGDDRTRNVSHSRANNLLNALQHLGSNNVNAEPEGPEPQPTQPGPSHSQSVVSEHRSLFAYRPPSSAAPWRRAPPLNAATPKRRIVTTTRGERIPVRNTWTRPFICLAKKCYISAIPTGENQPGCCWP